MLYMSDSISKATANKIVNVLKDTIQHDITFMDTDGRIIACTNAKRVGCIHGGSLTMLQQGLQTLVVQSDNAYEGTCSGINMALTFHDKIVGVVGITGDPNTVGCYGDVIRRMTELLLMEDEHKRQIEQRRYDIDRFLHQWVQEEIPIDDAFKMFGLRLGIDITVQRRVVVASLGRQEQSWESRTLPVDYAMTRRLGKLISRVLGSDYQNLWYFEGHLLVLLLQDEKDEALCQMLMGLRDSVWDQAGILMNFGCDNIVSAKGTVRDGYQRAVQALYETAHGLPVAFYKDIDLGRLLRYVPKNVQDEYIAKIFVGQTPQQINEWCQLIDAIISNNGSISAVAQQLYIHKNTVQYRIAKLQNISGYDCRLPQDIPVLYLAKLIWCEQFADAPNER